MNDIDIVLNSLSDIKGIKSFINIMKSTSSPDVINDINKKVIKKYKNVYEIFFDSERIKNKQERIDAFLKEEALWRQEFPGIENNFFDVIKEFQQESIKNNGMVTFQNGAKRKITGYELNGLLNFYMFENKKIDNIKEVFDQDDVFQFLKDINLKRNGLHSISYQTIINYNPKDVVDWIKENNAYNELIKESSAVRFLSKHLNVDDAWMTYSKSDEEDKYKSDIIELFRDKLSEEQKNEIFFTKKLSSLSSDVSIAQEALLSESLKGWESWVSSVSGCNTFHYIMENCPNLVNQINLEEFMNELSHKNNKGLTPVEILLNNNNQRFVEMEINNDSFISLEKSIVEPIKVMLNENNNSYGTDIFLNMSHNKNIRYDYNLDNYKEDDLKGMFSTDDGLLHHLSRIHARIKSSYSINMSAITFVYNFLYNKMSYDEQWKKESFNEEEIIKLSKKIYGEDFDVMTLAYSTENNTDPVETEKEMHKAINKVVEHMLKNEEKYKRDTKIYGNDFKSVIKNLYKNSIILAENEALKESISIHLEANKIEITEKPKRSRI